MKQSDQHHPPGARARSPPGPIIVDDWRIALPPKPEVYGTIEGVIAHFKLVMEGIQVPAGRGLRLHRGRQRRAGLVPGERRQRPPVQGATSARPGFPILVRRAPHDRGQDAGGPHSHLRHHQHDRRRGRAVSDNDTQEAHRGRADASHGRAHRHPAAEHRLRAVQPARGRQLDTARGRHSTTRRPSRRPPRARRPSPRRRTRASSPAPSTARKSSPSRATNMIEAAKPVGSEIPYYCYHPRLSIAANCRMCLVEASNAPKLVPACQTPLAEGVVIKTTTPKVKEQQRAVMEFLLLNHPVDCSICDQAGECKLQDYYMQLRLPPLAARGRQGPEEQAQGARAHGGARPGALHPLHPLRALHGRGGQGAAAGRVRPRQRTSASTSSPAASWTATTRGNTVDICPVGALLNRDFRFRARALVPLRRARRLHRLLARLQHLRGLHGPGHLPLPPARERGRSTRAGCATRAGSRTSTSTRTAC